MPCHDPPPAAIGTFELASVLAGRALGIPDPDALALGLLSHVVTPLPFVVAGGWRCPSWACT